MSFKAPFLKYDDIRSRAEAFLSQYHPTHSIPVPIEYIVDVCFEIDLFPVPGLQNVIDTVACLSQDMKTIYVDDFVYYKRPTRYRFSLAHEIGHCVLHADIFQQLNFDTIEKWKSVITNEIPEDQYGFIEYHANAFAGLILVPSDKLRDLFLDCVEKIKQNGVKFDEIESGAREIVESYIARDFEVSSDVIHRRIEKDELW